MAGYRCPKCGCDEFFLDDLFGNGALNWHCRKCHNSPNLDAQSRIQQEMDLCIKQECFLDNDEVNLLLSNERPDGSDLATGCIGMPVILIGSISAFGIIWFVLVGLFMPWMLVVAVIMCIGVVFYTSWETKKNKCKREERLRQGKNARDNIQYTEPSLDYLTDKGVSRARIYLKSFKEQKFDADCTIPLGDGNNFCFTRSFLLPGDVLRAEVINRMDNPAFLRDLSINSSGIRQCISQQLTKIKQDARLEVCPTIDLFDEFYNLQFTWPTLNSRDIDFAESHLRNMTDGDYTISAIITEKIKWKHTFFQFKVPLKKRVAQQYMLYQIRNSSLVFKLVDRLDINMFEQNRNLIRQFCQDKEQELHAQMTVRFQMATLNKYLDAMACFLKFVASGNITETSYCFRYFENRIYEKVDFLTWVKRPRFHLSKLK